MKIALSALLALVLLASFAQAATVTYVLPAPGVV